MHINAFPYKVKHLKVMGVGMWEGRSGWIERWKRDGQEFTGVYLWALDSFLYFQLYLESLMIKRFFFEQLVHGPPTQENPKETVTTSLY